MNTNLPYFVKISNAFIMMQIRHKTGYSYKWHEYIFVNNL